MCVYTHTYIYIYIFIYLYNIIIIIIGALYGSLGDHKNAVVYLERALKIRYDLGVNDEETSGTADMLEAARIACGEVVEDETPTATVLESLLSSNQPCTRHIARRCIRQAQKLYEKDDGYEEEITQLFLKAGKFFESEKDWDSVATCHNNAGSAFRRQDDFESALEHHKKALDIQENKIRDANSRPAGIYLSNIGTVLYSLGRYEEALEYQHRSLTIRSEVLGDHGEETQGTISNIQEIVDAMESGKGAEQVNRKGNILKKKGRVCFDSKKYDQALRYFLDALPEFQKQPANTGALSSICNNIGYAYHELGNKVESINFSQQALDFGIDAHGNTSEKVKDLRNILTSFKLARDPNKGPRKNVIDRGTICEELFPSNGQTDKLSNGAEKLFPTHEHAKCEVLFVFNI